MQRKNSRLNTHEFDSLETRTYTAKVSNIKGNALADLIQKANIDPVVANTSTMWAMSIERGRRPNDQMTFYTITLGINSPGIQKVDDPWPFVEAAIQQVERKIELYLDMQQIDRLITAGAAK